MPKPIKHREMVQRLRFLGWGAPESGGKHLAVWRAGRRLSIPNPHRGDIDWSLMKRVLQEAGISREEWESAGRAI